MAISKIDLLSKKFNRCMRGYCTEEVDLAVHDAAEALGSAADENRRLQERVHELERMLASKGPDSILSQAPSDFRGTMAAGRKIVDEIHVNAKGKARRIIEDARAEASRVKAEANLVKARLYEEIADIRAQRDGFEQEMRKLLEDHFRLLESQASSSAERHGGDFIFTEGNEGKEAGK